MLTTFRGDALERDGRWPEAEKLYYAAWKEDPTQLHFLYKISTQYWDVDPGLFQQEEKLQKTIFSRYTYLTAYMKTDKSQSIFIITALSWKRFVKMPFSGMPMK